MKDSQVVPIHTTIPKWQKAMMDQFAKDEGLLTFAEALRRALTEWRDMKALEAGIPLTALPQEEEPA